MIDIDVLKKLYDNPQNYFIGQIDWYVRLFTLPYEARIILFGKEKFEEITVKELQQLSDSYLEQNIPLDWEYSPFQVWFKMKRLKDVYVLKDIPNNIWERIIEVRKTPKSLRDIKKDYEDFLLENAKVEDRKKEFEELVDRNIDVAKRSADK